MSNVSDIYFLSRRKFVRKLFLLLTKQNVCLISSLPKSGTWAMKYFLSVINSLNLKDKLCDPFNPIQKLEGLGMDACFLGHFFCPNLKQNIDGQLFKQWDDIYSPIHGIDWMSQYINKYGSITDPLKNGNCRIVFIYRNPFDQMVSYFSKYYDEIIKTKSNYYAMKDRKGNIMRPENITEFITNGGIQSYVKYYLSYKYMKDILGDNLLFITYESLINDRKESLKKLLKFLSNRDDLPMENIDLALELTSKANLKALEKKLACTIGDQQIIDKYYRALLKKGSEEADKIVGNRKGDGHIRDGKPGKWKDIISDSDIEFCLNYMKKFSLDIEEFGVEL